MITYSAECWGFSPLCKLGGSVFPKAFTVALPSAALAVVVNLYLHPDDDPFQSQEQESGIWKIWSGYTTVLGFLIVFRNNQAYTRFWEGATLINQVRGEWFNAVSCLIAFSTSDESRANEVQEFQHTLVRLASILYCFALQQICDLRDDALEIIKIDTMDKQSVEMLTKANDKCELVIQWMQRLIVKRAEAKTLDIPPPILSRAFQELSRGIVKLNDVRKISEIPVPFPYAQMLLTMLLVHWCISPLMAAVTLSDPVWAGALTFVSVSSYWSLYFIALEIDQPFGEDKNDLPVREMQKDFNRSLLNLLEGAAQTVPTFNCPRGSDNSGKVNVTFATLASNVGSEPLGRIPSEVKDGSVARNRYSAWQRGSQSAVAPSLDLPPAMGHRGTDGAFFASEGDRQPDPQRAAEEEPRSEEDAEQGAERTPQRKASRSVSSSRSHACLQPGQVQKQEDSNAFSLPGHIKHAPSAASNENCGAADGDAADGDADNDRSSGSGSSGDRGRRFPDIDEQRVFVQVVPPSEPPPMLPAASREIPGGA